MTSGVELLAGKVVTVTGAGGHFGQETVKALVGAGCAAVRAVDLDPKVSQLKTVDRVTVHVANINDSEAMEECVVGADVVIHIASYGMGGPAMLDITTIRQVNVGGTLLMLKTAAAAGVKAFVYTSSYNAVFGGQPIIAGEEDTCAYFPPDQQVDEYSRSKTQAEQAVLSTNPKCGYADLKRCAIRPAAIFGPHEERHMPRIVNLVQRGLVKFAIGSPDVLVDWVYVDNLVSAHLLAAANLLSSTPTAHLEAFCISDDHPVNQFEFLAPLFVAVGGEAVNFYIPTSIMLWVGLILEWVYQWSALRPIFEVIPLLTRAEVNKVGVTHFFKMDKARRILNYKVLVPHPEGLNRLVSRWAAEYKGISKVQSRKSSRLWSVLVIVLLLIIFQAAFR